MRKNNQIRVTICMDPEVWKKFKKGCDMNGCIISKLFLDVIKQKLAAWERLQEVQRPLEQGQFEKTT